jgi:hypothetical protein
MLSIKSSPDYPRSGDTTYGAMESPRRAVYRRLKASYGPTYLTILSVIQAVAMGDLAQVVAGGYQRFTTVQWVLTLNTFGVLIIIWNAYSVQSTLWGWIPDVRDSAAPFVVGALELYLNHTIIVSLSAWLVAVSLVGVAGAAGTLHIYWRASREQEQLELLRQVELYIRLYVAYLLVGGAALLALAWLCADDHLHLLVTGDDFADKLALGVALFSALALGGGVYVLHQLWRAAIAYARAEHHDGRRTPATGRRALHLRQGRHPQSATRSKMGAGERVRSSENYEI